MRTGITRRLAGSAAIAISTMGLAGPAVAATTTSQARPGATSVADAESNLKNALTVVESWADGKGGVYPSAARAERLPRALRGDGDARLLASVFYRSAGGRADTYTLSAYAGGATYWLSVVRGVVYYGRTRGSRLTSPAPGDRRASQTPWAS